MTRNKAQPHNEGMPNPVEVAAKHLQGQANLARALGVAPPTVNQWIKEGRPVPEGRGAEIERLTGGVVTVEELCPDARWVRIPDAAWPHPKGRPVLDVAEAKAA